MGLIVESVFQLLLTSLPPAVFDPKGKYIVDHKQAERQFNTVVFALISSSEERETFDAILKTKQKYFLWRNEIKCNKIIVKEEKLAEKETR